MLDRIPFSWLESDGWLVLAGSKDTLSEMRAQALSRLTADGAIAYISLVGDLGDSLMEDMADLGAPTGYYVDLEEDDNNEIYERLSTAGMIIIEPGDDVSYLKKLMTQTVIRAFKEALNLGGLIMFEGIASNLAGEHIITSDGQIIKGLAFVNNVFISSDVDSILEIVDGQKVYETAPQTVFIGIPYGSALVLGPSEHIETWGEKQVTISLGSSGLDETDSSNNNL
jgi:hypothetical protein